MAGGSGETSAENPLPLNVVPLIDVIFCLLLFFMCSFHFKTLEGKIEAWLPRDKGIPGEKALDAVPDEIRIVLERDMLSGRTVRRFGRNEFPGDAELGDLLRSLYDAGAALGKGPAPVVLACDPRVPWEDVIRVMDLTRQRSLPRLEFALARSAFEIPDVR
jgi:biopolymer transport protein ExbD